VEETYIAYIPVRIFSPREIWTSYIPKNQ